MGPRHAGIDTGGRGANLFIAGVPRAGTTSLYSYLGAHDQVCPSGVKETGFFTPLRYPDQELEAPGKYAAYFSHCTDERYRLEASPGYFYGGTRLIDGMRQWLGTPKILISLRDPVSRLISDYRHYQSRLILDEQMSLAEYIARCKELRSRGEDKAPVNQPFFALSAGLYSSYIRDWLRAFGAEVRVVFFERLVADPDTTLRELYEWLGLPSCSDTTGDLQVHNAAMTYRFRRLQALAVGWNRSNEGFLRRHPRLKNTVRRAYYAINAAPEKEGVSEASLRELERFYAEDGRAVYGLLYGYGYRFHLPEWVARYA